MRAFASLLSRLTSRAVHDRTGVTGEFNFTLTWTPDDFQRPDPLGRSPANPEAPSLCTALQEQLGLKLESTRAPAEVMVIDHAERPTEDSRGNEPGCCGASRSRTPTATCSPSFSFATSRTDAVP